MIIDTNLERWATIKDIPEYEVSNFGRVRNRFTKEYITPYATPNGYVKVFLPQKHIDNPEGGYIRRLDKLVCQGFQYNPHNYDYVRHKDGDLNNCIISNLCWVSHL